MKVLIPQMQLIMWERKEVKERKQNPASKEWEDTGEKIEKTQYTLRDEFGDVLKFLADNEYRPFEGSMVQVVLEVEFNEWQNKNTVKLDSIEQIAE